MERELKTTDDTDDTDRQDKGLTDKICEIREIRVNKDKKHCGDCPTVRYRRIYNNKILIMKKKLYQKPNIKVHELPMDALLAASPEFGASETSFPLGNVNEYNPTRPINSKRGNLWGDDEE